jgi:16S rRNA C967 or C1407 C5-methylase (RsmB/RsmF family)
MQLVRSKYHLGGPGLTGSVTVGDSTYSLLQKEEADMVQRFDPGGDLDTMGFFIAKFKKRDKT